MKHITVKVIAGLLLLIGFSFCDLPPSESDNENTITFSYMNPGGAKAKNVENTSEYACFVSVRNQAGTYDYWSIYLHFPEGVAQTGNGHKVKIKYRDRDNDGVIRRLANCWIPASREAADLFNQVFKASYADQVRAEKALALSSSTRFCNADGFCCPEGYVWTDESRTICYHFDYGYSLPEIVVDAEQGNEGDPGGGWDTPPPPPDGNNGPPNNGNDNSGRTPCTNCDPGGSQEDPCQETASGGQPIECERPCDVKANEIKNAYSTVTSQTASTLETVIEQQASRFGINNSAKLQHFLSQAAHETGGLSTVNTSENLTYTTPQRIVDTWPGRYSLTDPSKTDPTPYVNNPQGLANHTYANRGGNGNEASGDGWKYRGRGAFQLSGKNNYRDFTTFYQQEYGSTTDFVSNPDIISSNATISIISGLWYFKTRVLNTLSDNQLNPETVTRKINGGDTGLDDREAKFNQAQTNINCESESQN